MSSLWGEMILSLYRAKERWQGKHLRQEAAGPSLHRPIIVHSVLDHACLAAAWILFSHVQVKELFPDGTWKSGVFCYSVWLIEDSRENPWLMFREFLTKERALTASPSMHELACEMDRVVIQHDALYVRDYRILQCSSQYTDLHCWRKCPRLLH